MLYHMQDSIFSSFLFLHILHINDLSHAVISSDVHQYADDTLMIYCNLNLPMLEVKFHDDINHRFYCSLAVFLEINMSKTEISM